MNQVHIADGDVTHSGILHVCIVYAARVLKVNWRWISKNNFWRTWVHTLPLFYLSTEFRNILHVLSYPITSLVYTIIRWWCLMTYLKLKVVFMENLSRIQFNWQITSDKHREFREADVEPNGYHAHITRTESSTLISNFMERFRQVFCEIHQISPKNIFIIKSTNH